MGVQPRSIVARECDLSVEDNRRAEHDESKCKEQINAGEGEDV